MYGMYEDSNMTKKSIIFSMDFKRKFKKFFLKRRKLSRFYLLNNKIPI